MRNSDIIKYDNNGVNVSNENLARIRQQIIETLQSKHDAAIIIEHNAAADCFDCTPAIPGDVMAVSEAASTQSGFMGLLCYECTDHTLAHVVNSTMTPAILGGDIDMATSEAAVLSVSNTSGTGGKMSYQTWLLSTPDDRTVH